METTSREAFSFRPVSQQDGGKDQRSCLNAQSKHIYLIEDKPWIVLCLDMVSALKTGMCCVEWVISYVFVCTCDSMCAYACVQIDLRLILIIVCLIDYTQYNSNLQY